MEHDFCSIIPKVKFTMSEIKCIMQQILRGCEYLHERNIIHRDLKSTLALTQLPTC